MPTQPYCPDTMTPLNFARAHALLTKMKDHVRFMTGKEDAARVGKCGFPDIGAPHHIGRKETNRVRPLGWVELVGLDRCRAVAERKGKRGRDRKGKSGEEKEEDSSQLW